MSDERSHIDLAIVRAAIRSDRQPDEGRRNAYEALDRLEAQRGEYKAETDRLRAAIQAVLDDDETRTDGTGWGPDVTMVHVLQAALQDGQP